MARWRRTLHVLGSPIFLWRQKGPSGPECAPHEQGSDKTENFKAEYLLVSALGLEPRTP